MLLAALLLTIPDTVRYAPAPYRPTCGADSAYTRVPVYVRATVATPADTTAASSLLLIAEAVATRIRTTLSGSPDSLPRGDSLVVRARGDTTGADSTAVGVRLTGMDSAGLRVVARRGASLHWTPVGTVARPVTALLDRALADAERTGDTFIPSDLFSADSIVFTLDYVRPFDVAGGRIYPRAYGPATLATFSLRTAVEHEATIVPGTLEAQFPEAARSHVAEGFVRIAFVVDTGGRAVASTVHDVWPKDRPRLTGELGAVYRDFVRSGTDAVLRALFYPAEVAGCKVRQLVQLPITFQLQGR